MNETNQSSTQHLGEGILAGIFRWLKDVIEEADKPLSLLITVLLPFIAPVIPALVTADHLQKYMDYTPNRAYIAAVAFALVGYVSMVTAIGSITNFVEQEHNKRNWLPVIISSGSYLVYVFALVLVNIILESNQGVEGSKISVTALMTLGLEIPSSLLNGTRITARNRKDADQEKQEDEFRKTLKLRELETAERLEALRIKKLGRVNGPQVSDRPAEATTKKKSVRKASDYKEQMAKALNKTYDDQGIILKGTELAALFKLDYHSSKGVISAVRKDWARSRHLIP